MNIADWIALGIIAIAVVLAVIFMVRHGNSCGCGSCPYSGECRKNKGERTDCHGKKRQDR
jgi:hypothetical protein